MPVHRLTHAHKQGNLKHCHLFQERSGFQTLSGSEFAFSVKCKSGWIKQHWASADGLSLCICVHMPVCLCACALMMPTGIRVWGRQICRQPLFLSGPIALFSASLKVSFSHSLCFTLFFPLVSILLFLFFLINKKEAKTVIPKLSGWAVACRRCQERVNLIHISLWELRWKFASFFSSALGAQEIFIVLSRLNKDSLLGWLIISWYNEESTEGRSINNAPKLDLRSHCCCCWQPQIQRTQWDQNSNVYSVKWV